MSKIIYRGSHPQPKYGHGDTVIVAGVAGVVQHRKFYSGRWHYDILVNGMPHFLQLSA